MNHRQNVPSAGTLSGSSPCTVRRSHQLTSRETEILELLADGMNNRQIARRLFLAEKTVRNYVSRIFTKLEVHDRAAAVLRARDAGFGDQPDTVLPQHA
ncbi:response regulator transcription factor [Streptomyces sp. NPDC059697]|uniref:response regulator transcription factor n=1 Tax=Streptomyces sp. NPDC059697 TaxID=3346912 RepID=UPI0036B83A17